jgi:hypothetical protein
LEGEGMDKQDDTNGLNFSPPRNLIAAHSMIQQWYIYESNGQAFAKEFFTLEHIMQFSMMAIRSALSDSLIWLFIYVLVGAVVYLIQENYLAVHVTEIFSHKIYGSPLFWMTKFASFMGLSFSTVLCIMMSRYYAGVVPKKAINSIFFTRAIFLTCFSVVAFLGLGVIFRALSDGSNLNNIYRYVSQVNPALAVKVYYFIVDYLRRALFESAIVVIVAGISSAYIPFFAIVFFRMYKKRKADLGICVE